MVESKPRISVVIPIYNEESTIQSILRSILAQRASNFILEQIIVVSDGSTDASISEIKKVVDKRILLFDFKDQQGQNARLNFAYTKCNADIVMTLDGDIVIKDSTLFQDIVTAHMSKKADVVCGNPLPLQSTNFIEKVAAFGTDVDLAVKDKLGDRAMRYRLIGRIFSCTKKSLEGLTFPLDVSNDVYFFYFILQKRLKIVFEPKAVVFFKLPSTSHDIVQQYKRHLHTNHHIYFSHDTTVQGDTRTMQHILPIFLKKSVRHPLLSTSFVFFYVRAAILARHYHRTATWEYIASTKKSLK